MNSTHRLVTPVSLLDAQIAEAALDAGRAAEAQPRLEAPSGPRRPLVSIRGLIVTWALCLSLTVLNIEVGGFFTPPLAEPSPAELVAGLRISAAMNGRLIEGYLAEQGVLPLSLEDVGLPEFDPDLLYERLDPEGFRVTVRHGEFEGSFDSRLEAERRAALAAQRSAAAEALTATQEAWAAEAEQWILEAEGRGLGSKQPGDTDDTYEDAFEDAFVGYPEEIDR